MSQLNQNPVAFDSNHSVPLPLRTARQGIAGPASPTDAGSRTELIFLSFDPDEQTWQRIENYKHRVRKRIGEQLYLSDPPHLTLYLAAFSGLDDVLNLSQQIARRLAPLHLTIAGWHTFVADALTGMNTLVCDLDGSSRATLQPLQQQIVEALAPHRQAEATLARIAGRLSALTPSERDAAERHGFPYVGPGWHPHLTIASVRLADWPAVEQELLLEQPHGEVTCRQLAVYRLVNGRPSLVESFELGPPCRVRRCDTMHQTTAAAHLDGPTVTPDHAFQEQVISAIWSVVDRSENVLSATLTGSFLTEASLASASDIDLVLVIDQLTTESFHSLQESFAAALRPVMSSRGLDLRINPTLGPLKFDDERTAVLHLMLYTPESHRDHVIASPFTCLDWQRSKAFRKRSLASIYPVHGLQPRHFFSGRRSAADYLRDFEQDVVSYRELDFDDSGCRDSGCRERRRDKPMTARDRHEFAYHVVRFLSQNLHKLLARENRVLSVSELASRLPELLTRNAQEHQRLFTELQGLKRTRFSGRPVDHLSERLRAFVHDFEAAFRSTFVHRATRHVLFRHAATALNHTDEKRRFLGRTDAPILLPDKAQAQELIETLSDVEIHRVYASPWSRCQQSLQWLGQHVPIPQAECDPRLSEIDYGACEGQLVRDALQSHPHLAAGWQRGADPAFPGGECTRDVAERATSFVADAWGNTSNPTLICTHNVVLRTIVGTGLGIPAAQWHRIEIPHLAPITIVQTRDYGWFVDLRESVERQILDKFFHRGEEQN